MVLVIRGGNVSSVMISQEQFPWILYVDITYMDDVVMEINAGVLKVFNFFFIF